MKTYDVTITATVTKIIRVQATDPDSAADKASEPFSPGAQSKYPTQRYDDHIARIEQITEDQ